MSKHTPEKWTAFGREVRSSPVVLEGKLIAVTPDHPAGSAELAESHAHARLIAAAPTMRGALSEVFKMIEDVRTGKVERGVNFYLADAQAVLLDAIAKAEGRGE